MDDEIALDSAASVREDAVLDVGSILHITSTENKDQVLPPLRVVATRQTAVVEQIEPPNVNLKGDDATMLDQGDSTDDECATHITTSEIDAKKELDDLQILAYSSLVETINVNNHERKLLFLTNSQAVKLATNIKSVDHFCLSMSIDPRPQLVIILSTAASVCALFLYIYIMK